MGRNRLFRRRESQGAGIVGAILDGFSSHLGHGSRDNPHFRRGSHIPSYGLDSWDPGDLLPDDDDDVDEESNDVPLRITTVDYHLTENRKIHNTDKYEDGGLLVRRGQMFILTVFTNRSMDYPNEKLHLKFSTGSHPKQSKRTLNVAEDDTLKSGTWGCKLVTSSDVSYTYHVITPHDAIIGRYKVTVLVVTKNSSGSTIWKKHLLNDQITLLFNPWWHEDQVYIDGEPERQEYVLSDTGRIYMGTETNIYPRPWVFGQFESVVLEAALYLLQKSDLDTPAYSNPVLVCRALSAMTNSNDDSGVVAGRWDGNYSKGIPPSAWIGSSDILARYMKSKKPVKYGQCWVFAAVLTTLCRSLGLATRCVTNYASAHDKDYSMSIDYHRDENGSPLPRFDDSIWNFHVWNESWFERPDLPAGFGGWQAFDSTPQEASEGRMQCGPASVAAVRDGLVYLGYDTKFVFAEVNGDIVYWIVDRHGIMNPIYTDTNHVGKLISTKAIGSNTRYDITRDYKHPEGTEEERKAVERAAEYSSRRHYLPYDKPDNHDVTFEFDGNMTSAGDIQAKLMVSTSREEEGKEVEVHMYARAKYYTGVSGEALEDYHVILDLSTKKEASTTWSLDAANMLSRLTDDATVAIYIMGKVKVRGEVTDQVYVSTETFVINKPDLQIEVGESLPRVNVPFELRIAFENPLSVPLTGCTLHLDGPGIQRVSPTQIKGSIAPGSKFIEHVNLVSRLAGSREIVGCFHSKQLNGITGVVQVNVTD